jgi:type II secretion system protein H
VTRRATGGREARRRRAFTLVEMLAVMVIFGLMAAIALPNLGVRSQRRLDEEARRLASSIEFVRQRAVMTGVPHRIFFDLGRGAYQVESYGPPAGAPSEAEQAELALVAQEDAQNLALSPPLAPEREFQPLTGTPGDVQQLHDDVHFEAIATPRGEFAAGTLEILFEGDGTSEPAEIVLASEEGRRVVVHLEPLADAAYIERLERAR